MASPKIGKASTVRPLHKPLLEHGPQEPEEWRPVPGFESTYIASNLGRVARMIGHKSAGTYWTVFLPRKVEGHGASMGSSRAGGKKRGFRVYVHHIIALTFIGPPSKECPIVNHKDEDPNNNRPENLEWCDQGHNVRHALKLRPKKKRGKNLTNDQIEWIRHEFKAGRTRASIAAQLGRHPESISYWLGLDRLGMRNG